MKKILIALCAALLVVSAAGCGGALDTANLEPSPYGADGLNGGITMSAGDGTADAGTETLALHIQNTTETEYYFGEASTLEVYADGAWFVVQPKEPVMVIEIAYVLEAGGSAESKFVLSVYGTLPAGKYRVVKAFSSEGANTAAAGEFEIS